MEVLFINLIKKYFKTMELEILQPKIFTIRDFKVMLDFDLAQLFEIETRVLNQTEKRNINRFPIYFMNEWSHVITDCDNLSENIKHNPKPPFAFKLQDVTFLN